MQAPRFIIGVDGGATKTVALVATTSGKVLGRGEAGPSNYHNVGTIAASRAIKESVTKAKKQAGLSRTKADIAVVALAAVDSDRDRTAAERFVSRSGIARKNLVVHDSEAALYAATEGRQGIIVIAGTGCVAAGINKAGKYSRVSGWGYLVDDEGSAYDVGRKALMSAFRSIDTRAPKTRLVSALKRRFRVNTLEDALGIIYSQGFGAKDVAGLAMDVARTARTDIVSRQILNNAGIALAVAASAVASNLRMKNESFKIALVGGMFKVGRRLIDSFRKRIKQDCPYAEIELLKIEPARGALMLAVAAHRQLTSV